VAELQPTQTPWIIVATPTASPSQPKEPKPTAAPTESATAGIETATASPTEPASAEPTATQTAETRPLPTNTPGSASTKYAAPLLLDPANNRPVAWRGRVTLIWTSVGELAEDEYYHVHLERPPKIEGLEWWGDYVYTKGTDLVLEGAFLAPFHYSSDHGHAIAYWWVRVVRKTGEGEDDKPLGVDISPHSEKRTLILDPKPEGQ
jgi:hypothetical protein